MEAPLTAALPRTWLRSDKSNRWHSPFYSTGRALRGRAHRRHGWLALDTGGEKWCQPAPQGMASTNRVVGGAEDGGRTKCENDD